MHRASPATAAATAFVIALGFARDASAFCRTRTVKVDPGYDASVKGCQLDGVPLFWRNACVGYSMDQRASRKISYDVASNTLSQAFTRWTGASCDPDPQGHTRPSIDVRDLGPVACATVEYHGAVPNQNVILFRDDSWSHDSTVLGLTTVSFDRTTGEIFGADMELNTFDMDPIAIEDPVQKTQYDFASVATHEAGHFLGMGHSDTPHSTMYAKYKLGSTFDRELQPDDIEGICSIYRPNGERTVLNTQVASAPQCDPTPKGGYTTECYDGGCSAGGRSSSSWLPALAALSFVTRRRRRSSSR